MPMIYGTGTSAGVRVTVNNTNEHMFVAGVSGSVVTVIKKYQKIETTTETLPDSISLPNLSTTPTWTRYELRLSNTDFARESYTVTSYGTI